MVLLMSQNSMIPVWALNENVKKVFTYNSAKMLQMTLGLSIDATCWWIWARRCPHRPYWPHWPVHERMLQQFGCRRSVIWIGLHTLAYEITSILCKNTWNCWWFPFTNSVHSLCLQNKLKNGSEYELSRSHRHGKIHEPTEQVKFEVLVLIFSHPFQIRIGNLTCQHL
jgi:hypothetical protein